MSYYFLEDIIPLAPTKPPLTFPMDSLPNGIREYTEHIAKAVQVHPDMPAALALSALAACVQGKTRISITPEWNEELNLYIAVIAEPGERKSAVFSALTKPINDYVNNYNNKHAKDISAYRNRLARPESHKNSLISTNATDNEINEIQAEILHLKENPITEMRLIANDCTAEAIASVMAVNNDKIAILSDEGVFDIMAGLYSNGKANINIYLKSYDGFPILIDRKSSGSIKLHRPLITFGICCQPTVMTDFLEDKRFTGKGLAQRFLYCQPPSLCGKRTLSAFPADIKIKENYSAVIQKLLSLPNSNNTLSLSPDAFELFSKYYDEIETKIAQQGKYSLSRTFLSKLPGKTARICGIFHMCEHSCSELIDINEMSKAIETARYFDSQNEQIFNSNADIDIAEYVADRITANAKKDNRSEYRARDIKRFCQKYKAKEIDEALIILEEHKYISFMPDDPKKPNRQYGIYHINPRLTLKQ